MAELIIERMEPAATLTEGRGQPLRRDSIPPVRRRPQPSSLNERKPEQDDSGLPTHRIDSLA